MTPEGARLLAELAAASNTPPSLQPPAMHPPAGQYAPGGVGRLRRQRRAGPAPVPRPVTWTSPRGWVGPLGTGVERTLVDRACREAERIAGSRAWSAPEFESHRLVLDLPAELDQIDGQAHALAQARAAQALPNDTCLRDPGALPEDLAQAWESLVEHVAALAGYAARITAPGREGTAAVPVPAEPAADLLAGSAGEEFAVQRLRSLTAELGPGGAGG